MAESEDVQASAMRRLSVPKAGSVEGEHCRDNSFFLTLSAVRDNVIRSNLEESRLRLSKKQSSKATDELVKRPSLEQSDTDDGEKIILFERTVFALQSYPKDKERKINMLKRALRISDETHQQVEKNLSQQKPPEWSVSVTVCQARNLKAMDPNGLSEPYCTLCLSSQPQNKKQTSVQKATLTPVWDEKFTFTSTDVGSETLTVSIWDWEKDKSFLETASKIREVKSMTGLKRYVTHVKRGGQGSNSSEDHSEHLFMGKAQIHLQDLIGNEVIKWFPIHQKKMTPSKELIEKQHGSVFLHIQVNSVVQEQQQYPDDHEKLALALFRQYYMTVEMEEAEELLQWHRIFYSLPRLHCSIYEWLASWTLYQTEFIESRLLLKTINNITDLSETTHLPKETKRRFVESLNTCVQLNLELVKRLHLYIMKKSTLHELSGAVRQLKKLKELIRIFVKQDLDIVEEVTKSLHSGNRIWFEQMLALEETEAHDHYKVFCGNNQVLDSILAVLCVASHTTNSLFIKYLQVEMYHIMHKDFEALILEQLKSTIKHVCKNIDMVFQKKDHYKQREEEIGGNVFFCYFSLQEFIKQGKKHGVEPLPELVNYHKWFERALYSWLPMATSKAEEYIGNAVFLDDWEPVTPESKHSSSVIDALYIISEIEEFWRSLDWPDEESSKIFVSQGLIHAVYKLLHHYGVLVQKAFMDINHLSPKHLIMLNDLEHIGDSISTPLLGSLRGGNVDGSMLTPTMKSAFTKIIDKLDYHLIQWICSPVSRELQVLQDKPNKSEICSSVFNSLDEVIHLLYCQMSHNKLQQLLVQLWNSLLQIISDLIVNNNKMLQFYKNMSVLLADMKRLFHGKGVGLSIDELETSEYIKIEERLSICAMCSEELINLYYKKRHKIQEEDESGCLGILTLKSCFKNEKLQVEVLNGRKLPAADYSDKRKRHKLINKIKKNTGSSDPYVKLELVPRHLAKSQKSHQTVVIPDTVFPIFDQTFTFDIPETRSKLWLVSSVWDHDKISYDDFLGEVFIPLSEIVEHEQNEEIPQLHLNLTQSDQGVADIISILTLRDDDLANSFLKWHKKRTVKGHVILNQA